MVGQIEEEAEDSNGDAEKSGFRAESGKKSLFLVLFCV